MINGNDLNKKKISCIEFQIICLVTRTEINRTENVIKRYDLI